MTYDQAERDLDYARAYRRWIEEMTPEERARLKVAKLLKPDISRHEQSSDVDIDVARIAATSNSQERSDDFTLSLSEAMADFLQWVVIPHPRGGINPKAIAQRAVAAMWVLRPDIIGNLSLTEIGVIMDTGPDVLSRQASKFSKKFGIRGRTQFSSKTRAAQADSAKARHAREVLEQGGGNDGRN